MKNSSSCILTTHTGSLPRPADLVALLNDRELGKPYDKTAFDSRVKRAVAEVVGQQVETGIDVVDDGEHGKINWMAYARARLSGLIRTIPTAPPMPIVVTCVLESVDDAWSEDHLAYFGRLPISNLAIIRFRQEGGLLNERRRHPVGHSLARWGKVRSGSEPDVKRPARLGPVWAKR